MKKHKLLTLLTAVLLAWPGSCPSAIAAENLTTNLPSGETVAQRDARMKWWREARLGMFGHFGLYSPAAVAWNGTNYNGIAEWIQNSTSVAPRQLACSIPARTALLR